MRLDSKPACPSCGKTIDGVTGVDHEHQPKPGDLSVCLYCEALMFFTEGMGVRAATPEESEEIHRNPMLKRTLEVIREIRKKSGEGRTT
jgi:hypothetical protein